MATSRSWSSAKPTAKPSHQPRGVLRCRTIWLIWSVRLPKVVPGRDQPIVLGLARVLDQGLSHGPLPWPLPASPGSGS